MAVSAQALVSLAELKTHLSISVSTYDARLEQIIDGVSFFIEGFCGRYFVQRSVVEIWAGGVNTFRNGAKRIYVRHPPINSVTSVIDDASTTIASTDYRVYGQEGIIEHVSTWPTPQSSTGIGRYTVTYSAGSVANTAAVPADVKRWVLRMAADAWNRTADTVTSKTVGPLSLSYAPAAITPEIAAGLAPHCYVLV